MNIDLKIISKAFASRLKTGLHSIISLGQTAYAKKWFIGKSRRFVPDIPSVINNLKIKSYLVTMDIEKAFDSLKHICFKKIWICGKFHSMDQNII